MQHKTLQTKAQTLTDKGEFTAIAAAYAVDRVNDRIIPGAFEKTIAAWQASGKQLPLHWDHKAEPEFIIGSVDPASMRETEAGLLVSGKLDLKGSAVARDAWRLIKSDSMALSFGYLPTVQQKNADGVNDLHEIDLFEITVTPAPVHPDTKFLSFKSAEAALAEETATDDKEDAAVEDGSDEEPETAKSAPQDSLRTRSIELTVNSAVEGLPRYEPEAEVIEERPSVAELRSRSFEAILKIAGS